MKPDRRKITDLTILAAALAALVYFNLKSSGRPGGFRRISRDHLHHSGR